MKKPCNHGRSCHARTHECAAGERRAAARLLCSDLVHIRWEAPAGGSREEIAILEDVSADGACLLMGVAVPTGAPVLLRGGNAEFSGEIARCAAVANGYLVGVRLTVSSDGTVLSGYTPEHLLDISRLNFSDDE